MALIGVVPRDPGPFPGNLDHVAVTVFRDPVEGFSEGDPRPDGQVVFHC